MACYVFDEFVTNTLLDLEKMSVPEIYTRYFVRPDGARFASSAASHSNIQATCSVSDAKLPRTLATSRVMKCNSEGTDEISPTIRSTEPSQSAKKVITLVEVLIIMSCYPRVIAIFCLSENRRIIPRTSSDALD